MGQFVANSSLRYFCDLDDSMNGTAEERLKRFAVLLRWLLLHSSIIETGSGELDVTAEVSDFHFVPTNGIVSVRCDVGFNTGDWQVIGRVK
jgi:hypothetical protein